MWPRWASSRRLWTSTFQGTRRSRTRVASPMLGLMRLMSRMPKAAAICRTSSSPVRPLRRGGGAEEADRGKQDWMAPMNWYVRS